jgi:hypothetical protein
LLNSSFSSSGDEFFSNCITIPSYLLLENHFKQDGVAYNDPVNEMRLHQSFKSKNGMSHMSDGNIVFDEGDFND